MLSPRTLYASARVSFSSERPWRRYMCASYGARWHARRDHSPRARQRQPLRSFYIEERAAPARAFGCLCLCSLALALHLLSACALFPSLLALSVSLLPARCSPCFVSGLFSSFFCSYLCSVCLISASATPLACRVRLQQLCFEQSKKLFCES